MIGDRDVPAEAYWVEVGGEGRIPPFGMYKTTNLDSVEVVNSVTNENGNPRRWVFVRDGEHEVWVKAAQRDEYGYELRPDERVSEAELEAIGLKQAAMRDGSSVSVEEARALLESGEPEQARHALIALYYGAKADPDVTDEDVDALREITREHTGHVDTSHLPTLMRILGDVDDGNEDGDGA